MRAAGGPGWALAYHGAYEFGTPLADLPGGAEWQAVIERTAPEERHLAVHSTSTAWGSARPIRRRGTRAASAMLDEVTMSGTRDDVRRRLAELADHGVTEIVFQPAGPDPRRELEVFMETARAAVAA